MGGNRYGCRVDECDGLHHSRGFCRRHYTRWHNGTMSETGLPLYRLAPGERGDLVLPPCTIYGLRELGDGPVRYVGMTTQRLPIRFGKHRVVARMGDARPVYRWWRDAGLEQVEAVVLEIVQSELPLVRMREQAWIERLRPSGLLLNVVGV